MKNVFLVLVFILTLVLIIVTQSSAQIPRTLSYQGVLTDTLGNPRPDGSYTFTFRLYETSTGGSPIWTEAKALNVQRGLFSTTLGDITSLATLDFDRPYWLGIQVGSDPELQPRIGLTSVGYAFTALKADTADYALASTPSGNAGGDLRATYPNPLIAPAAVSTEKLADNAVTTEKIQDAAVTQSKLAPGVSLPPGGAAGGDLSGKYPNPSIANNAVTSDKIQDATIQQVDLAFIPATRPLAPPVATSEIAEGAVTSAKILDGTVQRVDVTPSFKAPAADTADYARASVLGGAAGGDLSGSYPNPTITSGAVTTAKLADTSVTTAKIRSNSVTASKIAAGQVVKSLNNLRDNVILSAQGGATISTSGDTLIINAGSGGGTGVQGIQSTNNTLDIINPSGPTVTINVKDQGITGTQLGDNAVTSTKVLDGTIQRSDVQSTFKAPLADTSDFARVATLSGTAGGDLTGTYPNPTIAANAVTSAKIADAAIQFSDIGQNSAATGQVMKWNGSAWVVANDSSGGGAFLPLVGGTMTGAITNTGNPAITMGKGNFGSGNINTGTQAFVAGSNNRARGGYSTVAGGGGPAASDSNSALVAQSTIGGGSGNTASGTGATIGGGIVNTASGQSATVGGGIVNFASGSEATVGGGESNIASGLGSTVPGGFSNRAVGSYSFAAGSRARANHAGSFVWADSTDAFFVSTGVNQFLIRASGGVGVGVTNPTEKLQVGGIVYSTTGGFRFPDGTLQTTAASGGGAFLPLAGGTMTGAITNTGDPPITMGKGNFGIGNINTGTQAFVAGRNNKARGAYSTVAGGGGASVYDSNSAFGDYSTVSGGAGNRATWFGTVSGGYSNNVSGEIATVGGGQINRASGYITTVGGGQNNTASGDFATVGGGTNHTANGYGTTVGGGQNNTAWGNFTTVGGGANNFSGGDSATVGGGVNNTADGYVATVGGGQNNTAIGYGGTVGGGELDSALGIRSTVPGGYQNRASGDYSFAAGRRAKADHIGAFVWGDGSDADFASTGANQFLIRASGGVGIGTNAPTQALDIAGTVKMTGFSMTTGASNGYVLTTNASGVGTWQPSAGGGAFLPLAGGTMTGAITNTGNPEITMGKGNFGTGNINAGTDAFVAGSNNRARGAYSTVAGGGGATIADSNSALGDYSTVSGGRLNKATIANATVSGGVGNTASGIVATVGGGQNNAAGNPHATISGGLNNNITVFGNGATIGGGNGNAASGPDATIGGGIGNTAIGSQSTVGGGNGNTAGVSQFVGRGATVGGGSSNTASGNWATVGGGSGNTASDSATAVGGGGNNIASGAYATVPGGIFNSAIGDYSFAAGRLAKANHDGAFVWGDGNAADFASTGANQFLIRASGGVGIGTGAPQAALHLFSPANMTVMRLQSSSTPGFGRIEFVSDPQGSAFEWRPGYIQSTDNGGFTGGLAFFVNGSGSPARFDSVEVMRLVNGRVGIGVTTPAATLHVNGTAGNNTGVWSNLSDRRLKTYVEPIRNALQTVGDLEGVTFRWKDEKKDAEFGRVRGLIAQDVEKVIPEWVKTDPDGYKRIEPIGINALLIEAIKEQQREIEELRAIVKSLVSGKNQREGQSIGEVR